MHSHCDACLSGLFHIWTSWDYYILRLEHDLHLHSFPEHIRSCMVISGVRVARPLVVMLCFVNCYLFFRRCLFFCHGIANYHRPRSFICNKTIFYVYKGNVHEEMIKVFFNIYIYISLVSSAPASFFFLSIYYM